MRLTGDKLEDKVYHRHTGYPGGIRTTTAAGKLMETRPERLLEMAVHGMLPKNRLGRRLFTKLKVYRGADHPHAAQKPSSVERLNGSSCERQSFWRERRRRWQKRKT